MFLMLKFSAIAAGRMRTESKIFVQIWQPAGAYSVNLNDDSYER